MLGRNQNGPPARHNLDRDDHRNVPSQAHAQPPYRPQRAKRAIPDPAGTSSFGSSFSQMSLFEDHASSHSSLPSSPSTVSLASSLVDARQLDSAIDLQEAPRPFNRRSNRDFRNVAASEIEIMNEAKLQESIRPRQTPSKRTPQQDSLGSARGQVLPLVKVEEGDEESYFGDILDKYCNSDEDPVSASPTSPFSTAPGWKPFQSSQPPTPPVSRSFSLQKAVPPPRRGAGAAAALRSNQSSSNQSSHPSQSYSQDSNHHRREYSRHSDISGSSTISSSPMNTASAKINFYQHGAARNSHDSLSKSSSSLSSLQSSTPVSSTATTRSYSKKPLPPPKDTSPSLISTNTSQRPGPLLLRTSSLSNRSYAHSNHHSNVSSFDLRGTRPELPPKDSTRRIHHSVGNSISDTSQLPVLSLDTQPSGQFDSFTEVVEASMSKHRASPSVSGTTSGRSHYAEPAPQSQPQFQSSSRTGPTHTYSSNMPRSGMDRFQEQQSYQSSRYDMGQGSRNENGQGQDRSHSSRDQGHNTNHSQQQQGGLYRLSGSASQPDLTASGYTSSTAPYIPTRTFSQPSPYINERSWSQSQGSLLPASSTTRQGYPSASRGQKSALIKTPIARARAKEVHGPRKVGFGDMITVVTIERTEKPPPVPPMDKKTKKKLKQSKKNSSSNGGQMPNFDPEYNAAFYEAPYTPMPVDVVVTLAPWIGNPNYDEEKQNSKFYYDDGYDHEYGDDDYEAPYESDIRLGPDGDDDDDEDGEDDDDEDEDDDDDEEYGSRAWGHGIAGPGGALPKKKGGMFKFKRAVNKLLRN